MEPEDHQRAVAVAVETMLLGLLIVLGKHHGNAMIDEAFEHAVTMCATQAAISAEQAAICDRAENYLQILRRQIVAS